MDTKLCKKCDEIKPIDRFSKYRRTRKDENGEEYLFEGYTSPCKDCVNARNRTPEAREREAKYREENRDKLNEYFRNYFKENKEAHNKAVTKWAKKNPDKVRETRRKTGQKPEYKEKARQRKRKYREEQPDIERQKFYRNYALKRGARFSEDIDLAYIRERDKNECYLCRELVGQDDIEYDHIEPAYYKGWHDALNVAVIHGVCNNKKWRRSPFVYEELCVLLEMFPNMNLEKINGMRNDLIKKLEIRNFEEMTPVDNRLASKKREDE